MNETTRQTKKTWKLALTMALTGAAVCTAARAQQFAFHMDVQPLLRSSVMPEPAATDTPDSSSSALPEAPSALVSGEAPAADALQKPFVDYKTPLEDIPHHEVTFQRAPKMIVEDLAHIFISPVYLRPRDLKWILPLTGAAITTFSTDTYTMSHVVSTNPSFNSAAEDASNALLYSYMATPAFMAIGGQITHNDHVRETGILGGEAMIDAYIVDEVIKLASFRERPSVDSARGDFYISGSGTNSSFVSGHCMMSWSAAGLIAGEYHNRWVEFGAYTGASGVALTRVLAQKHFPTDVLLGSAGGWLIGHYVYRSHHHAPHGKTARVVEAVVHTVTGA